MGPLLLLAAACAHHDLRLAGAEAIVPPAGDRGAHPSAQTEWWHIHADLVDTRSGAPLHVFAAFLVQRTDLDRVAGVPVAWFVNPFQAAYVQVSDEQHTWTADRYNVPDLFAARFVQSGADVDLHHGDWRLAWNAGVLLLSVTAGPHTLDLKLVPTAPPLRPGQGGRLEPKPGLVHLWSQDERMRVDGRWTTHGHTRWVEGTGFHKHQWGRLNDQPDTAWVRDDTVYDGFQWISLDLPDGGSLSVAWMEAGGSGGAPGSMAWLSPPRGSDSHAPTPLPVDLMSLTTTRTVKSRRSGAEWPVAFHLSGPGLDLDLELLSDQAELWVMPAPLKLGAARAVGKIFGEPVDTLAFIEQLGAKRPRLRWLYRSAIPPLNTPEP